MRYIFYEVFSHHSESDLFVYAVVYELAKVLFANQDLILFLVST